MTFALSMVLAEDIADKTLAYLAANSAAKVADVNTRFDTELTLPDFARYSVSDPEYLSLTLNDLPAVFVMPDTSGLDFSAGDGSVTAAHRFQIAVIAFANADNSETPAEQAKRASMRYLLAVVEMLKTMHSHSTSTYWVAGEPIHWGSDGQSWNLIYPTMRSLGGGEYVSDARLEVGVEHTEA